MKFFRLFVVAYCLSFGFMQQVNATSECKSLEFAELQTLNKNQLQLEYCLTKATVRSLYTQVEILQEKDSNSRKIASIDRMRGNAYDTSSVGKESEKGMRALENCQHYKERIERLAKKKKYNLQCD